MAILFFSPPLPNSVKACMFMMKPKPETGPSGFPSAKSNASTTTNKPEKKSGKKTAVSRQNNFDNIFTLGRHSKVRKQNDYENVFDHDRQKQEMVSRSASADFLNTADGEDNVFCSSTSASPDMMAIHLPPGSTAASNPTSGEGTSLKSSYVHRRSTSELAKMGSSKGKPHRRVRVCVTLSSLFLCCLRHPAHHIHCMWTSDKMYCILLAIFSVSGIPTIRMPMPRHDRTLWHYYSAAWHSTGVPAGILLEYRLA